MPGLLAVKRPFGVVAFVGAVLVLFVLLAREQWGTYLQAAAAASILLGFWSARALADERHGEAVMAAAFVIAFCCFAVLRGQDVNWDQRNYHIAGAFLIIHDLYDWNIAPGQGQNWFNPTIYALQYLVGTSLGSIGYALLSAALAAISAPLLYRIALEVQEPGPYRAQFATAATLVGLTAPMFLSEIGTTFFDIWAAAIIAAALLAAIVAVRSEPKRELRLIVATGLLLGAATGLKLTNGIYALAMAAAVLASNWPSGRIKGMIALAAGGAVGFLLMGGWWAWFLWTEYENPFFPQLNAFFGSPLLDGAAENVRTGLAADVRFLPSRPLSAAAYPLAWAVGAEWVSSELHFRDARFALIFILAAVAAAFQSRQLIVSGRSPALQPSPAGRILWTFFLAAFVVWIFTFAIHRYLVPLESVTGIILMLAILGIVRNRLGALLLFALAALFVTTWSRHPNWGHIPFEGPMLPSLGSSGLYEPNVLFVQHGDNPTGAAIASMPRDARFVRIGGALAPSPELGLGRKIHGIISTHRGPIRTLGASEPSPDDLQVLARFGLVEPGRCRTAPYLSATLWSCEVTYRSISRATPPAVPSVPQPAPAKLEQATKPPPPASTICTGSCAAERALRNWLDGGPSAP